MVNKKTFYFSVVELMKNNGITTGELVNKSGLNASSASRFLNGKSENASLDYIIKLCSAVGITVDLTAYVVNKNEL